MTDNLKKIERKVTHRSCPKCGFILSQDQAELSEIDFECPRCRKHTFKEFDSIRF